jgi:hypothetical protein
MALVAAQSPTAPLPSVVVAHGLTATPPIASRRPDATASRR